MVTILSRLRLRIMLSLAPLLVNRETLLPLKTTA